MTSPHSDQSDSWVVLYDADCGFCRWSLGVLLRLDREHRLRPVRLASPRADDLLSDLTHDQRMASWHLISPDGRRWSAGWALARVLELLPGTGVAAAVLDRMPRLTDRGYWWVAAHRGMFGRLVPQEAKRRAATMIERRAGERQT
jgi:predicted DCC family thiol-disulfide oxidoreductase YuxK